MATSPPRDPLRAWDLDTTRVLGWLCATALAAAILAPSALAADARYEGASDDGSVAFFSTEEAPPLVGDTDLRTDLFMRSYDATPGVEDFVTRKVSIGPTGGDDAFNAVFAGASEDGRLVVFATAERLVEADEDFVSDLYLRDAESDQTFLVSQGDPTCEAPECGNAEEPATFVQRGVTDDAGEVFFLTDESLEPADVDEAGDVYVRDLDDSTTTLVSAGDPSCQPSCGRADTSVLGFEDASESGSLVVFRTEERLAVGDDDGGMPDIYRRNLVGGQTALVSVPGTCEECVPTYGGSSADATHVVFETSDAIVPGDQDSSQDVYDWSGGAAALVSVGTINGNGAKPAVFPSVISGVPGISADGARVLFETDEQLLPSDEDSLNDVYERSGGATILVSRADPSCDPDGCGGGAPVSFRWLSPEDSVAGVVIGTSERLSSGDLDESADLYMRAGGATTLLSVGPAGGDGEANVSFSAVSDDGTRAFFITPESLVAGDEDDSPDVYVRAGETTALISAGDATCAPQDCGNGPFGAGLSGIASDGEPTFFGTDERLTSADKDGGEHDVYARTGAGTVLVSTGNATLLGPEPPSGLSTDPASPGSSTAPRIRGDAEVGAAIKIYASASCTGEPVTSGSAEELGGAGIEVEVPVESTRSFWLTAEAEGLTSPCAGPITYQHRTPSSPGGDGGPGGGGSGDSGGDGDKGGGLDGGGRGGSRRPPSVTFVAPQMRITFGPAFKTQRRQVVFRFADATGQLGTRFSCRIDQARWRGCRSPHKVAGLGTGTHVFQVKAVNAVGTPARQVAKRRFKVVAR
jgi:hypothetical protein